MSKYTNSSSIFWVKAHNDILGNEVPDQFAKEAALAGNSLDIPDPRSSLVPCVKTLQWSMVCTFNCWKSGWSFTERGNETLYAIRSLLVYYYFFYMRISFFYSSKILYLCLYCCNSLVLIILSDGVSYVFYCFDCCMQTYINVKNYKIRVILPAFLNKVLF